jgi:hypothetical protein
MKGRQLTTLAALCIGLFGAAVMLNACGSAQKVAAAIEEVTEVTTGGTDDTIGTTTLTAEDDTATSSAVVASDELQISTVVPAN